jgi:hypothetical protein
MVMDYNRDVYNFNFFSKSLSEIDIFESCPEEIVLKNVSEFNFEFSLKTISFKGP